MPPRATSSSSFVVAERAHLAGGGSAGRRCLRGEGPRFVREGRGKQRNVTLGTLRRHLEEEASNRAIVDEDSENTDGSSLRRIPFRKFHEHNEMGGKRCLNIRYIIGLSEE